jgi:hypothetical protein
MRAESQNPLAYQEPHYQLYYPHSPNQVDAHQIAEFSLADPKQTLH